LHVDQAADLEQVPVGHQLVRAHDRRIRHAGGLQLGLDLVDLWLARASRQLLRAARAHVDALRIGGQRRIVREVGAGRSRGTGLELLVADGADEQLLVVGHA
jgi:hypothetical protein